MCPMCRSEQVESTCIVAHVFVAECQSCHLRFTVMVQASDEAKRERPPQPYRDPP